MAVKDEEVVVVVIVVVVVVVVVVVLVVLVIAGQYLFFPYALPLASAGVGGYTYLITTLFVGCKQGGRSKNVSNNFDPCVFFPDGEGYMYLRPLLRQKPCPGRFTFREGG